MDKDGLVTIGRFARLTDLSPRLLRRLDERGLLSPAVVDPDTRYRYYTIGQTRVAGLIHLGRQMGLTIDQLADLIAAADHGDLHEHLMVHRRAVAARLAEQTRLLHLLDQELARGDELLTFEIALKEIPAILVMSATGAVPRTQPHDPWALEAALQRVGEGVARHIARQGGKPDTHGIILYHNDLSRDDEFRFEVCIPVARPLPQCPGVGCKRLPATRVAFVTFHGSYDTVWNAYVELQAWIVDHGYVITGPFREIGIVVAADTDDPREWVTELAIPIAG
jgi:DNA-binding transcriptional MerR regulator/DNA gyrase inhibitor GyrI